MLETIRSVDGENLLPLPADVLAALGLQPGSQVKVTLVGQSLIVQLPESAPFDSEFLQTFQGVLDRRRSAYQELAEGAN
jgi:antitoxin component of MazEF toxin-antitoxin module